MWVSEEDMSAFMQKHKIGQKSTFKEFVDLPIHWLFETRYSIHQTIKEKNESYLHHYNDLLSIFKPINHYQINTSCSLFNYNYN